MKQPSLFEKFREPLVETAPHVRGSETSKAAAESIAPHLSDTQRSIMNFIIRCGLRGATDEEISDALCLNQNTERPRRVELEKKGLIRKDGTRLVKSGRQSTVWRAK